MNSTQLNRLALAFQIATLVCLIASAVLLHASIASERREKLPPVHSRWPMWGGVR